MTCYIFTYIKKYSTKYCNKKDKKKQRQKGKVCHNIPCGIHPLDREGLCPQGERNPLSAELFCGRQDGRAFHPSRPVISASDPVQRSGSFEKHGCLCADGTVDAALVGDRPA